MLEQRENKNDLVWSTTKWIFKLARFVAYRIDEWIKAAISKLILLSTKRCRSYIVLALAFVWNILGLSRFWSKEDACRNMIDIYFVHFIVPLQIILESRHYMHALTHIGQPRTNQDWWKISTKDRYWLLLSSSQL